MTMLSKEVCMKCVASFATQWGKWSEHDDMSWEREGKISCPYREGVLSQVFVKGPPPPGCHRMLEHAVAAGCVNIDKKKDTDEEDT